MMMTSEATRVSSCGLGRMYLGVGSCCMSWSGSDLVFQVSRQQAISQVVCKAFL